MEKKKTIYLWTVLFWLLLWQLGSMALNQEILLVSPLQVVVRLGALVLTADFTALFYFPWDGSRWVFSWLSSWGQALPGSPPGFRLPESFWLPLCSQSNPCRWPLLSYWP